MYNVYLISSEINNKKLYKIGYTKRDVEKRIKEFKTGNASCFEIVDIFTSTWGVKIEKTLHKHFNNFKVEGEWFDLNENQIKEFDRLCKITHENLEVLEKYNTYIIDRGGIKKIRI